MPGLLDLLRYHDAGQNPQATMGLLAALAQGVQPQPQPAPMGGAPMPRGQVPFPASGIGQVSAQLPMGGPEAMPTGPAPAQTATDTRSGSASMRQPASASRAPAPSGGGLGSILSGLFNPGGAGRNRTVQFLTQQGMDEGTATLLAGDKTLLRSYLGNRINGGGASEFQERAQAAQQFGLQPGTPDFQSYVLTGNLPSGRYGTAERSLTPIYGKDKDGKTVVLQLDKAGNLSRANMPDGVDISPGIEKIDLGTQWGLMDKRSGQIVGYEPKDVAGEERQKKFGQAQGEAAFDLPRIEQNASQTLALIDDMLAHPGRGTATGMSGTFDPRNYLAGTDATNFRIMLDQAKGKTFLEAYQSLKGGGQITEVEGKKAEEAIARLNTAQSDEAFVKALEDFKSVIQIGLDRARRQAGAPVQPAPAEQPKRRLRFNPETGELE